MKIGMVMLVGLTACSIEPIDSTDEAKIISMDGPCIWQSCEGEDLVSPVLEPEFMEAIVSAPNKQKLRACLDACEKGADAIAAFCRRVRNPIISAVCWTKVLAGEPACKGFCYWYYS